MSAPRGSGGGARAELVVAALLFATGAGAVSFVIAYAADASTQVLGLALGLALMLLAAAAIVAGKAVVSGREEVEEERPWFGEAEAERELGTQLGEGVEGVSRRRLLLGGLGAAGTALGAAVAVPVASLGPAPGEAIGSSPWRAGIRLVDEDGRPLRPEDVAIGTFVTAFAAGADRRALGTAVVLVKLPTESLALPPERSDWAPSGVLAYSKICTHAGCAINLYRYPLFAPTSPRAALVCPCHYSTFDPARAGERIFGPAGRSLPQLPLAIDERGLLVAAGDFSEPVGPSWSGVRSR